MIGKVTAGVVTLLAVLSAIEAYPLVGGGKRYSPLSWTAYPPVVYQPRSTRYASYYDAYAPDAVDLYYGQDPYDKYRVVQLPGGYYLPEQYYPPEQYYVPEQYPEQYYAPEQRPEQYYTPEQHPEQYYYPQYEDDESLPPAEDELPDAAWYNSPDADTNAVFLQNLVLAQLYRDAANRNQRYPTSPYWYPKSEDYDEDGATYVYGEAVKEAATAAPKEDKDVMDLKSLVDAGKKRPAADTGKQRRKTDGGRRSLDENRWVNKRAEDESAELAESANVREPVNSANDAGKDKKGGGQDEVMMMRPAVPVRTAKFHQRSYQPSAYDAIKKLLIQQNNEKDRQPQKRSYVLNEDSLVQQLGKLKKSS